MSKKNSQAGDVFLADVFSRADPAPISDLLARHDALLRRVTVLERALEKILATEDLADDSHEYIYGIARKALDA